MHRFRPEPAIEVQHTGVSLLRIAALASLVVLSLTGCGGADDEDPVAREGEARRMDEEAGGSAEVSPEAQARLALYARIARAYEEARLRAGPVFLDAPTGRAWDWELSLPAEGAVDSLELAPQRGRGYAEPLLRLVPRAGHGRSTGEPLRPDCRTDSRCEYNGPVRFSVTLPNDAPLRAVPRGDAVALVARVLAVDQPVAVRLRLQAEGRPEQFREIVLLP